MARATIFSISLPSNWKWPSAVKVSLRNCNWEASVGSCPFWRLARPRGPILILGLGGSNPTKIGISGERVHDRFCYGRMLGRCQVSGAYTQPRSLTDTRAARFHFSVYTRTRDVADSRLRGIRFQYTREHTTLQTLVFVSQALSGLVRSTKSRSSD